jgi:hypothetical protein
MKQLRVITVFAAVILLVVSSSQLAYAQAFRKGSLVVSLSEGATYSKFKTSNSADPYNDVITTQNINGDRDPLIIEYGITDRWGIGLTSGGDIYRVNPSTLYNFQTTKGDIQAITGEFTVDANYHFYITKRVDLSGFGSVGLSGISIQGNDGDHAYEYKAGGGIIRVGAKAKYYVLKRFGIMGMVSAFSTNLSPDGAKENTMGQYSYTSIKGFAWELGLCYRILR